jgi:hypothetical protein
MLKNVKKTTKNRQLKKIKKVKKMLTRVFVFDILVVLSTKSKEIDL